MANVVVQVDAATPNIIKLVQTVDHFTVNAAVDVDSSSAPNDSLLIWNANTTRYELRAFTDLPIDGGTI